MIGPDWKWGDQDGGKGYIGAVYRLKKPTEVQCIFEYNYKSITPKNKYYQWQDDYQRKRKITLYKILGFVAKPDFFFTKCPWSLIYMCLSFVTYLFLDHSLKLKKATG